MWIFKSFFSTPFIFLWPWNSRTKGQYGWIALDWRMKTKYLTLCLHHAAWHGSLCTISKSYMHGTFLRFTTTCFFTFVCTADMWCDVVNSHLLQIFTFDTIGNVKLKTMLLEFNWPYYYDFMTSSWSWNVVVTCSYEEIS